MVGKRFSNDEIIKKIEEIKKDIEITSKIIDKKLINIENKVEFIQKESIKSKGRSIGYAIFTVAAISLTAFIVLKDFIFLYFFFVVISILIIIILHNNRKL